jgi:hypothetical protein
MERAGSVAPGPAGPEWIWRWSLAKPPVSSRHDALSSAIAAMALVLFVGAAAMRDTALEDGSPAPVAEDDERALASAHRAAMAERVRYRGGEKFFGAYGGAPYTYASDVRIARPGADLTVHAVDWQGKPFDHPIYYGLRAVGWLPASSFGGMIDFTHSKVYAPLDRKARFSGSKDGAALSPEATIGDRFHKLEFTHGHNMLTANVLWRLAWRSAFIAPYAGIGLGVSLPHTEVQLKGEGTRTYEYQYTGPAAQALFGVELRLPHVSYFVEYKLTFASYRAPLHNRDGDWVFSDLLAQLRRWVAGQEPEGGWATTRLLSHQVISGMGVRTSPPAPPAMP